MPSEKHPKAKSVESLRHAEYYDMQRTFDELYTRSQAREVFDNLMELILSKDNIMLAYRNIKSNSGSATPGTDRLRITDIGRLPADEVVARVRKIVRGGINGYTPRSVRRKEIPKPNGKTRPLGIPCIWDRLIQQCIKQVMEPICEAKFSSNSYGFRPNRSVENAIAAIYRLMQRSGLYYVVEFDVKGFFDNVDALTKAQPRELEASEIDVRLGATWLDPNIIQKFMTETFQIPYYLRHAVKVRYSPYTAEWRVEGKTATGRGDIISSETYGTSRANAYKILEETLNLKDVRIRFPSKRQKCWNSFLGVLIQKILIKTIWQDTVQLSVLRK